MAARLPILHKTPFVLDGRLLHEATSPHAGALSISRAYRSLAIPPLVAANLNLRKRERGFSEGQFIESIALRRPSAGSARRIMRLIKGDNMLGTGSGLPTAERDSGAGIPGALS